MKLDVVFDRGRDYGAATLSIQQIIAEWAEVEWLQAPRGERAADNATEQLDLHHALARAYSPELFSTSPRYQIVDGGWPEFAALCAQVRGRVGWDWKFAALKPLCSRHSRECGWALEAQGQYAVRLEAGVSVAGALFVSIGAHIMWHFSPRLAPGAVAPEFQELIGWYLSYANMDLSHCLEWQLAEQGSGLTRNPFLPLLRCYAEGFLPFGLSADEFVLFAFR